MKKKMQANFFVTPLDSYAALVQLVHGYGRADASAII